MKKKINRNDPCHCGSGKKYKNCCMEKDESGFSSKLGMIGLVIAVALGLLIAGMAISGSSDRQDCPPGTSWSDAHQHCH
ncbi:MAG: SEC-C metal-binding domain-containing protein [Balneolaceae bacterium]